MELTVQNVFGLLLRSKLMGVDEARAMFARWKAESKDNFGNLKKFADWIVANKYLTEYQAALLIRGHADVFFLNDYKILDRLGKGRMAGVYRAQHRLGQVVAIKVLPPSKAAEPALLHRFQREARLSLKLKHPNIVRAYQMGLSGNLHYLVMEYLEGETLDEVLARRGRLPWPPAEAVRLVWLGLQGLQHIHAQGLVHRDLKPSNLMLVPGPGARPDTTMAWGVKILDIGLGRVLFDEGTSSGPDPQEKGGLTSEGVLLGTPDFMSPEQARDARAADIRSDIYSMGCVLYRLLAGQVPFPDTNIISQMIRHATETPQALKEVNPAVPDGLQQIVNWMMAKDAAQRYPTPERAAQALQVFLAAGAEALQNQPQDARLSSYLMWLESENDRAGRARAATAPPAAQGSGPRPVLPPGVPPVPSGPGTHKTHKVHKKKKKVRSSHKLPHLSGGENAQTTPKDPTHAKKHRRKKKRSRPAPPLPPGMVVDVELVPYTPRQAPAKPILDPRLDRREMLLLGVGVGAGALATFLGCWFALRRPPKPDEVEKTD